MVHSLWVDAGVARRTLSGWTSAFAVRTFAVKILDGDLHFVVRSRVAPVFLQTLVDR